MGKRILKLMDEKVVAYRVKRISTKFNKFGLSRNFVSLFKWELLFDNCTHLVHSLRFCLFTNNQPNSIKSTIEQMFNWLER